MTNVNEKPGRRVAVCGGWAEEVPFRCLEFRFSAWHRNGTNAVEACHAKGWQALVPDWWLAPKWKRNWLTLMF